MNGGLIEDVIVRNGRIILHRPLSTIGGLVGRANGANIVDTRVERMYMGGSGYRGGIVGFADRTTVSYSHVHNTTITLWITRYNRSAGGIVGVAQNGSVVSHSGVLNVTLRFNGSDNISNRDLAPRIGLIVGNLDRSSVMHVGQEGSSINRGTLQNYRWGLFNNNSNDQRRNVGNGGPWGSVGRTSGTVVII